MPSKYEKVLPGLKPEPVRDQNYQDKVDKVKQSFTRGRPDLLAQAYVDLCVEDAEVKKRQYDINLRFAALEQALAESEEIGEPGWGDWGARDNALRLIDGSSFRVQPEPYGQVKDKEAFRLWCIQNGYERQLQLWPSTMNSVCKERLVAGDNLPDGCEVFVKQKIVYTPGTKKEKS